MTEHNTSIDPRTCYALGCKRVVCVEANTEYQRQWRRSPSGIVYQRGVLERRKQARAQRGRDQAAAAVD